MSGDRLTPDLVRKLLPVIEAADDDMDGIDAVLAGVAFVLTYDEDNEEHDWEYFNVVYVKLHEMVKNPNADLIVNVSTYDGSSWEFGYEIKPGKWLLVQRGRRQHVYDIDQITSWENTVSLPQANEEKVEDAPEEEPQPDVAPEADKPEYKGHQMGIALVFHGDVSTMEGKKIPCPRAECRGYIVYNGNYYCSLYDEDECDWALSDNTRNQRDAYIHKLLGIPR